jgi:hypothetical protein
MYQRQKRLAMSSENASKIYFIETKIVISFLAAKGIGKKKGRKMTSIFLNLLKTNVEKMPDFRLAIMLLKIC